MKSTDVFCTQSVVIGDNISNGIDVNIKASAWQRVKGQRSCTGEGSDENVEKRIAGFEKSPEEVAGKQVTL